MKFEVKHFGQTLIKYQVPLDIFSTINHIYETQYDKLVPANKGLAGKIQNEHSLYYNGESTKIAERHNFLPQDILEWFNSIFKHYLIYNKISNFKHRTNSIWINEMKENEYNPLHIHNGSLFTGLSSVMILKLPNTYGKEYSAEQNPTNGRLQIISSENGQFGRSNYQPPMNLGDFYVFPYDMKHCVYPFNGTNETRRTLAANCDVDYNLVMNKGINE